MKLLNLDPLVKSVKKRVVVVNGKNHEIRTLNVEQFLQIVDESKSIVERAEKGEFTLADEVRLTRKVVGLAIPTMTEEEINKLDVSQIQAIAEFAKGNDVEGVEEVSSEETQEDPEGK
ncbi:hypothetical protein [Acinetobacter baumannii]|uniref:hypothetical protein n=1 Tax=Acinetobacter baumannii TaxID=470 RepID=UPI000DE6CB94|nr:hypothetical protein [Acinetobacter baumannii]SSU90767.1 Uncharacterised protein [Acinetobacter baumannii]